MGEVPNVATTMNHDNTSDGYYKKVDGFFKDKCAYLYQAKNYVMKNDTNINRDDSNGAQNPAESGGPNLTNMYTYAGGFLIGSKAYYLHQGKNYIMKFGANTKLNIMNKVGKESIFRFDKAHVGHHEFNHINLNPKYSKLTKTTIKSTGKVKVQPYDPHIKLPPGTLTAGTYAGKLCKTVNNLNEILVPIVITADTIRVGNAAYKDYNYGSTRNTVEKSTEIISVWSMGYAGAKFGSCVGTGIIPGIGTIIGGVIGGVTGGVTGSYASKFVGTIGDAMGYDMVKSNCKCCGREFIARKYQGETDCKNHLALVQPTNDNLTNATGIVKLCNYGLFVTKEKIINDAKRIITYTGKWINPDSVNVKSKL